jgi:hypothetical protein
MPDATAARFLVRGNRKPEYAAKRRLNGDVNGGAAGIAGRAVR